ncbi:MAG: SpoIIE family protein phosphatase, partial [Verrucomicrobia bacterium]|nr:SpoIIE family protein phosphatase [Verrucomicrobiota bacterium]
MKLLVLAQTPPPLHGQSLMVQTLVAGLPAHGIAVHHVNLGLSRDAADIGRWRTGKFFAVFGACLRTIAARFRHRCDTLYYVPAPGKRGALYRDWTVMLLCRPFFGRLVFHWHAAGLGEWLTTHATAPERWITQLLLSRADLSIVLAEALRGDATALHAKKIAVVANGIADPLAGAEPPPRSPADPFQVLFLGLCSEEKGLFATAEAVLAANQSAGRTAFALIAAGPFPDAETERRWRLSQEMESLNRRVGSMEDLERSVEEAKRKQLHLLPVEPEPDAIADIAVVYRPLQSVSGDFLDFYSMEGDRFGVSIGDVSGHGVETAIIMGMAKMALRVRSQGPGSVTELVTQANRDLFTELRRA